MKKYCASLVMALTMSLSVTAYAGLLQIKVDKGTTPNVKVHDNAATQGIRTYNVTDGGAGDNDGLANGVVEIKLGTDDVEKKLGSINIIKQLDHEAEHVNINIDTTDFVTLASIEPFDFPSFGGPDLFLASIDIIDLLDEGIVFNVGQMLNVVDGLIAESRSIIFKDISLVPDFLPLTQAEIDALPNYTGSVRVAVLDHLSPIPEPSSLVLCGAGLLAALLVRLATPRRSVTVRHAAKTLHGTPA